MNFPTVFRHLWNEGWDSKLNEHFFFLGPFPLRELKVKMFSLLGFLSAKESFFFFCLTDAAVKWNTQKKSDVLEKKSDLIKLIQIGTKRLKRSFQNICHLVYIPLILGFVKYELMIHHINWIPKAFDNLYSMSKKTSNKYFSRTFFKTENLLMLFFCM